MKTSALNASLVVSILALISATAASAQNAFTPGDILVSSSTYAGSASTITVGESLPDTNGATASNNGAYYQVFNNEQPDPNFGITAPITITQLTQSGASTGVVINVPSTYLSTSFSSKSELGLNLSLDGTAVTFMAYPAGPNQIDLSNSATPGNDFSGDTDSAPATYRAIGQLNANGTLSSITEIVDYSGDNARNAVLTSNGYYTVGASGSSNLALAGAELVTPGGTPGSNSTSLGHYGTKDSQNNFRGITIYNNTMYATKGSGGASSSVDTVYQIGTAGTLPTGTGNTVSILPGFNTTTQGSIGANGPHPFGIWFANATTLYVADEGTGVIGDIQSPTTGQPSLNGNNVYAGLEKWSYSSAQSKWILDYTLTNGLNIGTNYTVSGTNNGSSGSYTTAPDGLRNITGQVNGDGTVTIYAITSTASSEGGTATGASGSVWPTNNAIDEGCDPNQLVKINDTLSYTTASQASSESFAILETAGYGQVLRGISFAPSVPTSDTPTMPVWGLLALASTLMAMAFWFLPSSKFQPGEIRD
jgi:hypothetical protein